MIITGESGNKGKGKGKVHTITGHEGLDGMGGQRHVPAALPPGKKPGTHYIGGWVGPRAGLYGSGKISPPPGFDPRTIQPVKSRYTD
jgi:hypothetical protein